MKKNTLLLFLLSMFSLFSHAQDSFDGKKRMNSSDQKVRMGMLKYPAARNKSIVAQPLLGPRKQIFQMNGFKPQSGKGYIHDAIKQDAKGQVYFIKSHPTKLTQKKVRRQTIDEACGDYLNEVGAFLRVKNASEAFVPSTEHFDKEGKRHVKMQQYHQGIKIYGSELVMHLTEDNAVSSLNGRNTPSPTNVATTPKLSLEKAFLIAYKDVGIHREYSAARYKKNQSFKDGQIALGDYEESELVYYYDGNQHHLVWHLTIFENFKDRWEFFIETGSGTVVNKFYHTCTLYAHEFHAHDKNHKAYSENILPPTTASGTDLNGVNRPLNTFQQGGTFYLMDTTKPMYDVTNSVIPDRPIGAIVTLDLRNEKPEEGTSIFYVASSNNTWADRSAVSAHYNAEVSYEYFRNTFNRNSINGQGGSIQSIVNVADPNTGRGFDNAFWNGQFMAYGNGDVAFSPLAGALDVGGHEMSHGVIQNTANLVYQDQPGAINESFADIFGAMIDRDDWQLGEDIVTDFFPSGAMRDMQDPNNGGTRLGDVGWQPKDMSEFYTGTQDNGGVHINSGIPNRAYYLIATDIGKDKAEQIYYKALTDYLTVSSQFVDLRIAVLQSAGDLHGENSVEVRAVERAFDAVGITDGAPTDTDEDLPAAEGDNFILSYDVNNADPNTLYISNTDGGDFIPVSQTRIFRKPSVSDDGSLAIFVTENNTINGVELDRQNPSETEISDQQLWSSIALSKDGNRLAVVANDETNRIFIIDLVSQTNREFELFNPTTAEGVSTGDVLYPDALEWDYTGQYLIYDALNGFTNPLGADIEYWDVGIIKVWDNISNDFGDGSIQKLFTNLPEGVSIGNPSLSKTSNNILAFDMYDANEDAYSVLTANIETNTLVEVWKHDKLGFPNFSSTDDRLLFDGFDNNGDEVIGIIGLADDKLTPQGDARVLIPDAKWGIWYTEGGRAPNTENEKEITDFRFNGISPAVVGTINGTNIGVVVPGGTNVTSLVATFTNSSGSTVSVEGVAQQSGVTANDFTNDVTYRVTAGDGSTKDFLVSVAIDNPNDNDNDGVPNDSDQCPNTPLGSQVDVAGCEIFSLPPSNFRVSSTGESCIGSNNGSISISSIENLQFTATLTGNGLNTSQNFGNATIFENLSGGLYQICVTVNGQTNYEQCFDITVDAPEPLSVVSKIDRSSKTVNLKFSGAQRYIVTLNGTTYTTTDNELVLDLPNSVNTLSVKTDKDCQGSFDDKIVLFDKPTLYPNPLVSDAFSVQFHEPLAGEVQVQVFAMDGSEIINQKHAPPGDQITVLAQNLSNGLYLVKVTSTNQIATFKIVKQ